MAHFECYYLAHFRCYSPEYIGVRENDLKLPAFSIYANSPERFSGWVFSHKKEILINDYESEYQLYLPQAITPTQGINPNSLMYVPLFINREIIGLLCVRTLKKNAYKPQSMEILKTLAVFIAKDHSHVGSFDLNETVITDPDGIVKSGGFTISVSSIMDDELPEPVNKQLLDDLKSANFFNMALYPEAIFQITGVTPYRGTDTSAITGANYLLTDDFTMIGEAHPISFPAKVTLKGDSLETNARFLLDRTK